MAAPLRQRIVDLLGVAIAALSSASPANAWWKALVRAVGRTVMRDPGAARQACLRHVETAAEVALAQLELRNAQWLRRFRSGALISVENGARN